MKTRCAAAPWACVALLLALACTVPAHAQVGRGTGRHVVRTVSPTKSVARRVDTSRSRVGTVTSRTAAPSPGNSTYRRGVYTRSTHSRSFVRVSSVSAREVAPRASVVTASKSGTSAQRGVWTTAGDRAGR